MTLHISTSPRRFFLYPLLVLFLIIILQSCEKETGNSAVIWTNRPVFASYIELYNATHSTRKVVVEYVENPAGRFAEVGPGREAPDIVIADNLNTGKLLSDFATLESLFTEGDLDAKRFYAKPLEAGVYEQQHVVLPVSFSLPLIAFDAGSSPKSLSPFFITLSELRNLSEEFNLKDEHGLEKLGFSPLWEEEFLFLATLLGGADYHETGTGLPAWNGTAIADTTDFMQKWIYEVNGGRNLERDFTNTFFYEPPYKLIRKGRIRFYYHSITSYFDIPPEKRADLDYRWPAADEQIPVSPSILYMGIPHGAPGIASAKDFISWFFRTETQEKLLAASDYKRIRSFGISDGFSSLHQVNEEIMPRMYPFLVGHIPRETFLSFPRPVPMNWNSLREQVIEPWLARRLRDEKTEALSEELEKWIRQQPE